MGFNHGEKKEHPVMPLKLVNIVADALFKMLGLKTQQGQDMAKYLPDIAATLSERSPAFMQNDNDHETSCDDSGAEMEEDDKSYLYIVDNGNRCIRKITPARVITTAVIDRKAGYGGDNGPVPSAALHYPVDVSETPSLAISNTGAGGASLSSRAGNQVEQVDLEDEVIEDEVIKDEIFEVEAALRGLALHMQDSAAVTKAAEVAKRSLSDATGALLGASAQFDYLHKSADEAVSRVDIAVRELSRRSEDALSATVREMTKGAQDLLASRDALCSAAQDAAASSRTTSESAQELVSAINDLSTKLLSQVIEAGNTVTSTLSKEIKDARSVAENVGSHFANTQTKMWTSFSKSEGLLVDAKRSLDRIGPVLDETTSHLRSEILISRMAAATQAAEVQSTLKSRMKAADTNLMWMVVLQVITLASAATVAAKLLLH
jgi:hypothetical protein